jgi:dCMP deaminase
VCIQATIEQSISQKLSGAKLNGVSTNGTAQSLFPSAEALCEYATLHWREQIVTTDIKTMNDYNTFAKRPFFLLIGVDAPIASRHKRHMQKALSNTQELLSLEQYVQKSDSIYTPGSTAEVLYRAGVRILNTFRDIASLHGHLDTLELAHPDRIRPSWDTYFMHLASLAAMRSNCMKRRVGCVLVREKRVIATGYNGTPRGITNCNDGGCSRCNAATEGGQGLGTCLCLHAEENALLESGRERVGLDAVLYCNTCPCLTCSVKIAQVGVKEVVFHQSYSMDEQSAQILKEAGVILRQFSPPDQAF